MQYTPPTDAHEGIRLTAPADQFDPLEIAVYCRGGLSARSDNEGKVRSIAVQGDRTPEEMRKLMEESK